MLMNKRNNKIKKNKKITAVKKEDNCILKKENGITVIALMVLVIVLLILAGVSIRYALTDGGLFSKAEEAKVATTTAEEKEQVETAVKSAKSGDYMSGNTGSLTIDNLQAELDELVGSGKTVVTEIDSALDSESSIKIKDIIVVQFEETGNTYLINEDGEVSVNYKN